MFSPLAGISPEQIISQYSEWIYLALVVCFFIAISGLALRSHFDRPYVKPLIITMGLGMAFAVFKNHQVLTMIFLGWQTLGTILLICLTAAIPFSLAKGFGMGKTRATWLAYALLYLISWAHMPGFHHGLNDRGLGLLSLALFIMFPYALYRVVRGSGSSVPAFPTGKGASEIPEIKREANTEKLEAQELKREAVPITVKEIRSIEEMERALVDLHDRLFAGEAGQSSKYREGLARQIEAVMGKEHLFKANLLRLDKIFKRIGVLNEGQLREKKARLKNVSGKERKIIKVELQRQEEIVLIERTVRELERRMGLGLESFEKALAGALSFVRRASNIHEAGALVLEARRTLKSMKSIALSLKDLDNRMIHIIKFERSLLGKERKAA